MKKNQFSSCALIICCAKYIIFKGKERRSNSSAIVFVPFHQFLKKYRYDRIVVLFNLNYLNIFFQEKLKIYRTF